MMAACYHVKALPNILEHSQVLENQMLLAIDSLSSDFTQGVGEELARDPCP